MLRFRLADLATLSTPPRVDGCDVLVQLRWIKGDLLSLQRILGRHSSGGARYRCVFCTAGVEVYTDHVTCGQCAPVTLESASTFIKRLAQKLPFVTDCIPATPSRGQLDQLLAAFGREPSKKKTSDERNKEDTKAKQELLVGHKMLPPLTGDFAQAAEDVPAIKRAELAGDGGLHVMKELATQM